MSVLLPDYDPQTLSQAYNVNMCRWGIDGLMTCYET